MSYATPADLAAAMSTTLGAQLTDDSGTPAVFDDTVAQELLDLANAEIDFRVGQRKTTPVTAPANIVGWLKAAEVCGATWYAFKRRGISEQEPAAAAAYNDWKRWLDKLDQVADGTLDLIGAADVGAPATATGSQWVSNDPVYTSARFRGF